jgi:hypothetical protein
VSAGGAAWPVASAGVLADRPGAPATDRLPQRTPPGQRRNRSLTVTPTRVLPVAPPRIGRNRTKQAGTATGPGSRACRHADQIRPGHGMGHDPQAAAPNGHSGATCGSHSPFGNGVPNGESVCVPLRLSITQRDAHSQRSRCGVAAHSGPGARRLSTLSADGASHDGKISLHQARPCGTHEDGLLDLGRH